MSKADYLANVPANIKQALMAAHADKVLKGPESAQEVLQRFEMGESIPEIANSLGITHQAIYRHLLAHCPKEWQEHQSAKALARFDDEDKALDAVAPGDNVALGRARERIGLAKWILERSSRKYYGPDSNQVVINQVFGDPTQVKQEIAALEERLGLLPAPE